MFYLIAFVFKSTGFHALTCMLQAALFTYSLFMCQDENENEDENQSFGSF